jgi:hypothetical protein
MNIWPQEPWEGLEVNEIDGAGVGWVAKNDAHSTTLLAVTNDSSLGVKNRLVQWYFRVHWLLWN